MMSPLREGRETCRTWCAAPSVAFMCRVPRLLKGADSFIAVKTTAGKGFARLPMTFPVGADGRVRRARQVPSPNQDARPERATIDLLVIHNISLPPGQFGGDDVFRLFTNCIKLQDNPAYASLEGLRVSAHFFIRRNGELIQFVPCHRRAWHAGVSRWGMRTNCNDFSVGIELEGTDDRPFEEAQYQVLAALASSLCTTYPVRDMLGHSDVAPGRKTDPGPHFDWQRLKHLMTVCPRHF